MKVQLTGKRKGNTEILCGIQFEKGVAELKDDEVQVFNNLLSRYYAVEEVKEKAEKNATAKKTS